ncbi:MAG: hypothetical protein ABFS56_30055 [Pseudomonadota bacterium]
MLSPTKKTQRPVIGVDNVIKTATRDQFMDFSRNYYAGCGYIDADYGERFSRPRVYLGVGFAGKEIGYKTVRTLS